MLALSKLWLQDQVTALSAAILADHPNPGGEILDDAGIATVVRATRVIDEVHHNGRFAELSDQTLALIAATPSTYSTPDSELLPHAAGLALALREVQGE